MGKKTKARSWKAGDYPGGYPAKNGTVLQDGHGKQVGAGHVVSCKKIKPGAPGAWMSNERCSYRFKVDGVWWSVRGYGDGLYTHTPKRMAKSPRR